MTCLVWYFAIILLVDVDLHEAREAVFFDGVVKVFAEEGIQPDFINYVRFFCTFIWLLLGKHKAQRVKIRYGHFNE